MIWTNSTRRGRGGQFAPWLVTAALLPLLAVGCGDDDNNRPPPTATRPPATATQPAATATAPPATATAPPATATAPPATATVPAGTATPTTGATPNANASAACEKLVACKQCLADGNGTCRSTADCAGRLSADAAICINGQSGCDPTALGDCLFIGCDGNDPSGECQ